MHDRPPGGRLSVEQKDAVQAQVYRSQNPSAHQLRAGDIGPGSVPLADIAPKLSDPRSSRYHVTQAKAELGIVSTSKSSSGSLRHWLELQKNFDDPFMIDSGIHDSTVYLVLQTPFMKEMLQSSIDLLFEDMNIDDPAESRHGSITDGDHTFFRTANLLATCVFNTNLIAWVPVLYTYMGGLNTEHHRPHFRHLFQQIHDYTGDRFDRRMLIHVSYDFEVFLTNYRHLTYLLIGHGLFLCSTCCTLP